MIDEKKPESEHSHFGNQLHGREGITRVMRPPIQWRKPLCTRVASITTFTPMAGAIGVPFSLRAGKFLWSFFISNRT